MACCFGVCGVPPSLPFTMSEPQVSESLERIKPNEDIYFDIVTIHIIFLPWRKVSGWCFCEFCGFAGGVLCTSFLFLVLGVLCLWSVWWIFFFSFFGFPVAEDLPTSVHSMRFPFLACFLSVAGLEDSLTNKKAVSETEEQNAGLKPFI